MSITVTVVGSYPKPPREGGEFTLRKTLQALDRGEAAHADVRAAQDDLVREVIHEQVAAGVDLVTDGQVNWDDPQTRFAEGLEGFGTTGLIRYFDNNTYYRQPVVKAQVHRRAHIVLDEFLFAREVSSVPVKAVLTGPYTLAALSVDEHYGDRAALVRDLASALNEEARDLASSGATVVQFDEPALARIPGSPPGELDVFAGAAPALVEGLEATTVLQTYFGDVAGHGPAFFDLPFDVFGLDLVAGPANEEAIGALPADRTLCAGIADARNTRLETVEALARRIERLREITGPDRLWISPSAGLEFLPREAAEAKCRRLNEARDAVEGAR
ncbi:MAG TPA: methylcobamide--CoM methyltransferase [Actinomycetota bacterium]